MSNNRNETLSKIFEYGLLVPVLLVSGYLFVSSLIVRADLVITTESEKTYFVKNNIIISVIAVAFVLFISTLLVKVMEKMNEKLIMAMVLGYTLCACIVVAFLFKTMPGADQGSVMYAGSCFAKGDYQMLQYNWYLGFYPFQLPLAMFQEGLFRILGDTTRVVVFWNIFNSLLICWIQYLLFSIIGFAVKDDKERRWVYLFLIYDFPIILYTPFIYGTIISLALSLFAIFLLTNPKYKSVGYILLASVVMAVACLLRNNTLIFFIAISIFCVWELIKNNKKLLLFIPLTLVVFYLSKGGINAFYEARSGIEISEGVPAQLHVATGLSENDVMANGWYNTYTYDKFIELDYNNDAAKEFGSEEIKKSLDKFSNSFSYTFSFFAEKINSTWINSDFQGIWNNEHHGQYGSLYHIVDNLYHGRLHVLAETILNWFVVITYGGLFLFALERLFLGKDINVSQYVFLIAFLGGFLFHLFWETKAQYVIVYYALLFPYAALGWGRILELMVRKIKVKKH